MKEQTRMTLSVQSRIEHGNETEEVSFETTGCLHSAGGLCSLSYSSPKENEKAIFTTLSFRQGSSRIHLKHRGGVKSEVLFEKGETCACRYEVSPFVFDMTVQCHNVRQNLDSSGGEIALEYLRQIDGDKANITFHLRAIPLVEEN